MTYSPIAFVKKYCTETAQETAKDAVQVWLPPSLLHPILISPCLRSLAGVVSRKQVCPDDSLIGWR